MIKPRYIGPPYSDLYHCMGNTYGTWLPGDRRGFRTRHHRQDVPFDYKNPPPPQLYDGVEDHARELMKRDVIFLSVGQRAAALEEMLGSFLKRGISPVAMCVGRIHFHILAPFPDHDPRRWIDIAKKESSHYLKVAGLAPIGGLWAVRCECLPVKDESHRKNAKKYILDHVTQGAAIHEPEFDLLL
ncbi:hypothetical protein BH09PLA1_BH09PLA1_19480 [soil metagenome]